MFLRRLGSHIAHQWMGALALMLVLGGGSAYALSGHNTVFSDDIVNGEVHTKDLGKHSVTSSKLALGGRYISMGLTGQAQTGSCDLDRHYTPGSPAPAYARDALGYVHLRGQFFLSCGEFGPLTTLPAGYRPGVPQLFGAVGMNAPDNVANLDVWIRVATDGVITLRRNDDPDYTDQNTTHASLDGLTFRCAPSGVNGCP